MSISDELKNLASAVRPGAFVWVFADVTGLAIAARKQRERFDPNHIIDAFLERLGPTGTLILPTFNFDLRQGENYDIEQTKSVCGALSETARKRSDFSRSGNALHSFVLHGALKEAFLACDTSTSFGPNSPFALMAEKGCELVAINLDLQRSYTFIHHIEELERVPYRHQKKIVLTTPKGQVEYSLFAKKPGFGLELSALEKQFKRAGLIKEISSEVCAAWILDLEASVPLVQEELRANGAKSIIQFSAKNWLRDTLKNWGWRTKNDKIREAARTR